MVEVGGALSATKGLFVVYSPGCRQLEANFLLLFGAEQAVLSQRTQKLGFTQKGSSVPSYHSCHPRAPPALTSASSRFFLSLVDFFWKTLLSFFFLSDPLSLLVGCSSVSCPHFPQFVLKLTLFRLTVAVPHWPWCGYLSGLSLFFPQEKILETAVNVSTVFWYVFFLAYEGPCSCASRGKKWPLLRQFAHLERQLTGTSFSSQREIDPVRLGYHSFNFLYHSLHSLNLF